jgi:predicted nucleotidyltransferase
MRLSPFQILKIKESVEAVLGSEAEVILFGSRVDDSAKGGDIDLYVETKNKLDNRASAAARIAAKIQLAIGDQKVDVVLVDAQTRQQAIHMQAKAHGIALKV